MEGELIAAEGTAGKQGGSAGSDALEAFGFSESGQGVRRGSVAAESPLKVGAVAASAVEIKISAAERDILMMRWSKMRRCCALEMQVQ